MGQTLSVQISDATIRRYASDPNIRELNAPGMPYRFRYDKARTGGSWHIVRSVQGKPKWRKAGSFPALTSQAFKAALPGILGRLSQDNGDGRATVGIYETVGDVLTWFEQRMATDRNLSDKRKEGIRSAIKAHLRPRLGGFQLVELTRSNIDNELIWPLQGLCSIAHTRLVFGTLKMIMRKAVRVGVIDESPVAGMMFTDFIPTKIRPRDMRLRSSAVAALLADLADKFESDPVQVGLAVMMLAHGSRLGETRQARWADIDATTWHIPQDRTKTRHAHNLPITPQVRAFLDRYRLQQITRGYSGAFLFPGKRTKKPITARQAADLFARLGGGDWTSHDLRKMARTTWVDLGVDYLIGELLLNHKLKDMQAAYIHTHAETRKRDALERWHGWLDERGFSALHA